MQLRLCDAISVDEGAIVGAEILEHKRSDIDADTAMMAGDLRIAGKLMVVVRRAAKSRGWIL
jgi:hypothetical protein